MVCARVPVEEHLERGGRFDLGAEVHCAEAGLLAEGCGNGGEDGGARVGGVADGGAWGEWEGCDFGGGHFGGLGICVWLCCWWLVVFDESRFLFVSGWFGVGVIVRW